MLRPAQNKTQPPWVVQHEGWLLKRGAGWIPESPDAEIGISAPKTRLGLRKKAGTLRRGKAEKRRYFRLLASQTNQGGTQTMPPAAELRYYAEKPSSLGNDGRHRGTIYLVPGMEVQKTNASSFCLITKNRTYYLRPDVPEEESSMAQARISAGQWFSALQTVLETLSKHYTRATPNHRPSAVATEETNEDMERVDAKLVVARRAQFNAFDRSDNPRTFADLWVDQGLRAYDTIVDQFGPAKTDCQRLLTHFELNVAQMEQQLSAMVQYSYVSHDVSLREQRTMKVVLEQLNELSGKRKEALRRCVVKLKRDAIQPMRRMMADMDTQLENIVKYNSNSAKSISKHRRIVAASSRNVRRMASHFNFDFLQDIDDTASTGTGRTTSNASGVFARKHSRANSQQQNPANPLEPRTSAGSISQAFTMIRKQSASRRPSLKTRAKDQEEYASAKKTQEEIEQSLIKCEQQHTASMVSAIDSLEDLERQRLEKLKQVFLKAAQAELQMFNEVSAFLSDDSAIFAKFEAVDPAEDIKNTSEKLRRMTKSTLPNF